MTETLDPLAWAAMAGIVLLAYFIRGISGFGSGLVSVPLLAHFLPLTFVVPLILVTDFSSSLMLGRHTRRQVRWDELRPLLPFGLVGVVAGATLLLNLPRTPLLATLGALVLVFGIRNLLAWHGTRTVSRAWAVPAGLVGGTVSALFGTGGPPYVIYLNHRVHDKSELRATFNGLFLVEGGARLLLFAVLGLLAGSTLWLALLLALPLVAAGLALGHRVHLGLTSAQMQRAIGALLLASGGSLLWRAWVSL